MSNKTKVKYVNINNWNQPVFKSVNSKKYYGSVNKLFPYEETEKEVLKKVSSEDLVYFGTSFNCEPNGWSCDVEIIKKTKMEKQTFKINTTFIFSGTFEVDAETLDDANKIVLNDCGMNAGEIHTSNDRKVKGWYFETTPVQNLELQD